MLLNGIGKNKADLNQLKAGMELKTIQKSGDAKMESIFKAMDKNNNGIIEQNEVEDYNKKYDKDGDGQISKKEAKKFIKDHKEEFEKAGIKMKKKDIVNFLQQAGENTQDVEDCQTTENGAVLITYKDGSKKTVFPDKNYTTSKTEGDKQINNSYRADDTLESSIEISGDKRLQTDYEIDGKTPKRTIESNYSTENSALISETETIYEDGHKKQSVTKYKDGSGKT